MSDLFCIGLFADKYGLSSIYLQGTRSGANFVDDDGILINYFRWDNGEPQTDNYLRTSMSTSLIFKRRQVDLLTSDQVVACTGIFWFIVTLCFLMFGVHEIKSNFV